MTAGQPGVPTGRGNGVDLLSDHRYEILAGENALPGSGVTFGLGMPVDVVEGGDHLKMATMRTNDMLRDQRDGLINGMDLVQPDSWTWEAFTSQECYNSRTARGAVNELLAMWPVLETVHQPGKVQVLRYCFDGEKRRVYGRPRDKDFSDSTGLAYGLIKGSLGFALTDARSFSDEEHSLTIGAVSTYTGGWGSPWMAPWASWGGPDPATREAEVQGSAKTPVRIRIDGPTTGQATNLAVICSAWRVDVTALKAGESIIINSYPWVSAATRPDGSGWCAPLAPSTRVEGLELAPGNHKFLFNTTDSTGTSKATIFWRDAERGY